MNIPTKTTTISLKESVLGIKLDKKLITTNEAAERLGVTVQRVHALIRGRRLPAEMLGRDYVIREEDVALAADGTPGGTHLTDEAKAKRAATKGIRLPFEPPATAARPKTKARVKKTGAKKAAKKGSAK